MNLRIGELAKRANISRDTIRFYEKNGLISSEQGDEASNNYREYSENALLTLELIAQAKAAGFTLAELIIFTSQLQASGDVDFDGDAFLQQKIEDVEAKIEQSQLFLETLKFTKEALAKAAYDDI
ncbi:MerR family transcriptional regulator [Lentilitoribacter sp. EG35]|uniref:MerR family transcriptional regulator n=1 Tax=Lentilitoribacter sp. EG35 TaxID=3234192 RepID=UPI0034610E97